MKTKIVKITAGLVLFMFGMLNSQNNSGNQNANHPSIENLKVVYKSAMQTSTVTSLPFLVTAIPIATVTLKPLSDVSKIYFKLFDATTDSLLYSANYYLSDSALINSIGIKLFENNSGTIYFSTGQVIDLKPYLYRIQTEDALQNLSTIYSKIQ
jgi:uncharacterized membrane protein YhaH (DUF805 family)